MLQFLSVNKVFNGSVVAIDGVSLEVPRGEFCVLLGPSGSGKSTLLKMVNGICEPTDGKVVFDREIITQRALKSLRSRISMIHQQLNLVDRLSVISNILSGALPMIPTWRSMLGLFPLEYKRKACSLLEQVDLEEEHLYRRTSSLSGGQKQRVAIARAFILDPDVVLADEPVASLDPVISRSILWLLKQASRQRGSTVLCSLHQVELALEVADRVIGLKKGKLVYDGPPESLTANVLDMIYEGTPGSESVTMAAESFKNLILRRTLVDPAVKVEFVVS